VRQTFDQVYGELAAEHEELMALASQLAGHRRLIGLTPILERLHELLIRHFSHEQFPGGLYERMGAYGPEHHEQLKVLVEDHCVILSGVGAMLERSRAADEKQEATLLDELAELLAHLRRHEQREHALADKLQKSAEHQD
jgi:hypothetical protein